MMHADDDAHKIKQIVVIGNYVRRTGSRMAEELGFVFTHVRA